MNTNFLIKENKLDILRGYHQNSDEIRRYFPTEEFQLNQNFLQPAKIFASMAPQLTIPSQNIFSNIFNSQSSANEDVNEHDLENAIKLFEAMPLNRVQARKPRLWAYLSHGPYYKFIRARYTPNYKLVNYKIENYYNEAENIKQTIKTFINARFFTSGTNTRSLRRNGIASLWWAAELTHSPWQRYEGIKKENKDKYHYTKIILEQPNIYQQTFERTYGHETGLVFHLLDFINDNKLGRNEYEKLIMKLNSDLSYRILSIQNPNEIRQNIEQLAKY